MISGDASELGKISMMVGISAGYYLGVNWYRMKRRISKVGIVAYFARFGGLLRKK